MSEDKTASAGDFVLSLSDAIRGNPLPAALIGMGLIWLLTGGRSSAEAGLGTAGEGLPYFGAKGNETARGLGRSVSDTATSFGEGLSATSATAAQDVTDRDFSIGGTTARLFATVRTNVADLMERQPLMLGAIGLGVGAAMAATFSSTTVEADFLGQASADVQARAREIGVAATGQAADLADGITTAIAKEARTQGLTPEGLNRSAHEAIRKVENVIGQTAESSRT